MSLTHHWQRPTELQIEAFRDAVEDCRKLLAGSQPDIAGFDGTGEPILHEERIVFNGQAPGACEPFEIAAVEFDRRGRPEVFGHCKTGHLPYDLYVKASLIVLAHHLGGTFKVMSDADSADWDEARDLVEKTLGYGGDFSLSSDW